MQTPTQHTQNTAHVRRTRHHAKATQHATQTLPTTRNCRACCNTTRSTIANTLSQPQHAKATQHATRNLPRCNTTRNIQYAQHHATTLYIKNVIKIILKYNINIIYYIFQVIILIVIFLYRRRLPHNIYFSKLHRMET